MLIRNYLKFLLLISLPCISKTHVGYQKQTYFDNQRTAWNKKQARPIQINLFYQTLETSIESLSTPLFTFGNIVSQAKPFLKSAPLIIISHGSGGSALQHLWLIEPMVEAGYFVLAINHHGNTSEESKLHPFGDHLWWERSNDIQFAINALSKNKQWNSYFNKNNIGIAGFSLGGATAMASVGALTNQNYINDFCSTQEKSFICHTYKSIMPLKSFSLSEKQAYRTSMQRMRQSYKVNSIKAAFLIAPALMMSFEKDSLSLINIPIESIFGQNDNIIQSKQSISILKTYVSKAKVIILEGAGHYSFLSSCNPWTSFILDRRNYCQEAQGIQRKNIHQQVSKRAVLFFNRYLKGFSD